MSGVTLSKGERARCGHLVAAGFELFGGDCWDCMDRDAEAMSEVIFALADAHAARPRGSTNG